MAAAAPEIASIDPATGEMRLRFHKGQWAAWQSIKRIVLVLAGSQGGKTSWGVFWLLREIQRRGPGDYLVVTPTYPLLMKKALPEFLKLFGQMLGLGEWKAQSKTFVFSPEGQQKVHGAHTPATPTQVFFGHAQDPDSLESATAKAAWLDEAGQAKFRAGSWEAINRRLTIHQGRILITTTPYTFNWLKTKLYDEWMRAGKSHPEIDVIRFDSTENPAFPKAEFDRARKSLPNWRFLMMFCGHFTRPAGQIYDCFDTAIHAMPRYFLPPEWPRFCGMDFGLENTAAVLFAEEQDLQTHVPTGRWIAYKEYWPAGGMHGGKREPREHIDAILEGERTHPRTAGGSASEDDWREKFAKAGLAIQCPPVRDVEAGIDAVYELIKSGCLVVFDDLDELLAELESYSRELDDSGKVTMKIDGKDSYHVLDACRYACTTFRRGVLAWKDEFPEEARGIMADMPDW
jgi:hypothetical protein